MATHSSWNNEKFINILISDNITLKAELELIKRFTNVRKEPIKTPFYLRQLQVFYENDYSDSTISKALNNLVSKGILRIIRKKDFPQSHQIKHVPDMVFYYNSKIKENDLDLLIQKSFNIAKIVNQYSHPSVTEDLGKHLEDLVSYELRAQQFNIVSKYSNAYNGKKWKRSGSNLDIIATHKIKNLKIGVEIKNTLDIISIKDIREKIEICEFLGLTPVFAVRWLEPHIQHLAGSSGFAWIFKTQLYPLGYKKLVQIISEKLSLYSRKTNSIEKHFPVTVSGSLPQDSIRQFEDWIDTFV